MNILAVSGSLRTTSTNTNLLRAMAELAPPGTTVTLYNGLDDLPHFSPERDTDTPPDAVSQIRTLLRDADAIVICTPEYIHGMPGTLKNLLDWVVSSGEFVDTPVGALSASPSDTGGSRAHESLVHTLDVMSAQVITDASFTIPFVRQKLNAGGQVIDDGLLRQLHGVLDALTKAVRSATTD